MAVVAQGEDLRALGLELEEKKKQAADLEDALAKKEFEYRSASEEHKLLLELHTINQMTKRKLDVDVNRANRMPLSAESLARIVALEDELKLIDKRKRDLEAEAQLVGEQVARTERGIDDTQQRVATIKDVTGWERFQYASRGYVNADNLYLEHQKRLAKLEEEQQDMQRLTQSLTDHIDALSKQVEAGKETEDKYSEAQALFAKRDADLKGVLDEVAQIKRISQRKEKMLNDREASTETDQKKLKELEGDKRVLHADLARAKEATRAAEKSIEAQDKKLRQLEARLEAVAAFLKGKFVPEEGAEAEPEPLPVAQFNKLHEHLSQTRVTLAQRDAELDEKDEIIEALEHKFNVLRAASISRAAAVNQSEMEVLKEHELIDERVGAIEEDFQREYSRLSSEQQRLQQTLDRILRSK